LITIFSVDNHIFGIFAKFQFLHLGKNGIFRILAKFRLKLYIHFLYLVRHKIYRFSIIDLIINLTVHPEPENREIRAVLVEKPGSFEVVPVKIFRFFCFFSVQLEKCAVNFFNMVHSMTSNTFFLKKLQKVWQFGKIYPKGTIFGLY